MLVTLYGKGAVTIHGDQAAYHADNGQITVPVKFAAQVRALGFSDSPPPEGEHNATAAASSVPQEPPKAPPAVVVAGPVLAPRGDHFRLRDALIGLGMAVEHSNTAARVDHKTEDYLEGLASGLSDAEARELAYGSEG
jgi:hypothetical protein